MAMNRVIWGPTGGFGKGNLTYAMFVMISSEVTKCKHTDTLVS